MAGNKSTPRKGNHQKNKQPTEESKKSTPTAKKSSRLSPFFYLFVISIILAAGVWYDVQKNGGGDFDNSETGKVLESIGARTYVKEGWKKMMIYGSIGFIGAEKYAPEVYGKCKSIAEFAKDLTLVVGNVLCGQCHKFTEMLKEKRPAIDQFTAEYGLASTQRIEEVATSTWGTISNITKEAAATGHKFLMTQVFIGNLSQENLGSWYNNMTESMRTVYGKFREQIDLYAKMQ